MTATGAALMSPRSVRTQSDASFLIDRLPVGTYEVRAAMAGFKALVQNNVSLSAGFTATLSLKLEVGDITQSVTVESAAPLIDVTSAQNSTAFSTSLLENIPSGRDVWSTAAQIPGATSNLKCSIRQMTRILNGFHLLRGLGFVASANLSDG